MIRKLSCEMSIKIIYKNMKNEDQEDREDDAFPLFMNDFFRLICW